MICKRNNCCYGPNVRKKKKKCTRFCEHLSFVWKGKKIIAAAEYLVGHTFAAVALVTSHCVPVSIGQVDADDSNG